MNATHLFHGEFINCATEPHGRNATIADEKECEAGAENDHSMCAAAVARAVPNRMVGEKNGHNRHTHT